MLALYEFITVCTDLPYHTLLISSNTMANWAMNILFVHRLCYLALMIGRMNFVQAFLATDTSNISHLWFLTSLPFPEALCP